MRLLLLPAAVAFIAGCGETASTILDPGGPIGSRTTANSDTASSEFESPVRLKADGQFIDTGEYVAHAGPLITDSNADGKPDLLVGNLSGHIQVFVNEGTREIPKYTDRGLLNADGEEVKIHNW